MKKWSSPRSLLFFGAAAVAALVEARRIARRRRYLSLCGKVVVITGGSRGLGLVLARQLARMGAKIALCARNPVELEGAWADVAPLATELLALTCDVTDRESVTTMLATVRERLGPIDVLINNAGVIQVGPIEAMGVEDPQCVVIDEVAGTLLAMGMVRNSSITVQLLALGLFRLFDVWKPGVIDTVQNAKPEGVGIMADDVLAGILAGAVSMVVAKL